MESEKKFIPTKVLTFYYRLDELLEKENTTQFNINLDNISSKPVEAKPYGGNPELIHRYKDGFEILTEIINHGSISHVSAILININNPISIKFGYDLPRI